MSSFKPRARDPVPVVVDNLENKELNTTMNSLKTDESQLKDQSGRGQRTPGPQMKSRTQAVKMQSSMRSRNTTEDKFNTTMQSKESVQVGDLRVPNSATGASRASSAKSR